MKDNKELAQALFFTARDLGYVPYAYAPGTGDVACIGIETGNPITLVSKLAVSFVIEENLSEPTINDLFANARMDQIGRETILCFPHLTWEYVASCPEWDDEKEDTEEL
jgi:hypothetical protein